MSGKFQLRPDKSNHYRFRLKASNGQIIANSQGYESKAACLKGVASVKRNAGEAAVAEVER